MKTQNAKKRETGLARRHRRVRGKISGTAARPRMCVTRSNNNIYVQVIDDVKHVTLCAASSADKALVDSCKGKPGIEAAKIVGNEIAKRAIEKGITTVSFDRGGYLYHGRVKSLADGAREGGLKF
jgi:large subunit ribosomal protein L18